METKSKTIVNLEAYCRKTNSIHILKVQRMLVIFHTTLAMNGQTKHIITTENFGAVKVDFEKRGFQYCATIDSDELLDNYQNLKIVEVVEETPTEINKQTRLQNFINVLKNITLKFRKK